MTGTAMKKRAARMLNQLASDETTIVDGIVTQTALDEWMNDTYKEDLFSYLADKFPEDFQQEFQPFNTYTATGTVSSSSTGTTLVASSSIFVNGMVGLTVYNATDSESAVITGYTSATTVTIDTTIDDTWDGDTIYVLGNEYSLQGDGADIKEIVRVEIRYSATETDKYKPAEKRDRFDAIQTNQEIFPTTEPIWYPIMINVSNSFTKGIGIRPDPTTYQGKIKIWGVKLPPDITDSTEPVLNIPGISQVIINGMICRGLRALEKYDLAAQWEEVDTVTKTIRPRGATALLMSYKPKTRSGPTKIRMGAYISQIHNRRR